MYCFQTKRVPSQVQNKTGEPKDINLYSNIPPGGGPTLIKKPEKLRAGSPVQTESVHAPRHLPPLDRPPPYHAPYHHTPPQHTGSSAVSTTGSDDLSNQKSNYVVLNREFDGRAIDPGWLPSR